MSLRLAIKRSLEVGGSSSESSSEPAARPTTAPAVRDVVKQEPPRIRIVMKRPKRQAPPSRSSPRPAAPAAVAVAATKRVDLPRITKCIRNGDPSAIDEFGFVEISQSLPPSLIERIRSEAAEKVARHDASLNGEKISPTPKKRKNGGGNGGSPRGPKNQQQPPQHQLPQTVRDAEAEVEEISNAVQTDVSPKLLKEVTTAMKSCRIAKRTMRTVFGQRGPGGEESNYKGFVIETPKVLVTHPGNNPQLPHADDYCASCVICLIHLKDGQEPTRVAKYEGAKKAYPTGISVECDNCMRSEQLPDRDLRRGVHLTDERWHCNCSAPHTPYDFEGGLTKCFHELLEENAPNLCDSYAGPAAPTAGDGMFGLPMLVHRGPGNPSTAKGSRYVLFLTLRPKYRNMKEAGVEKLHHRYNPALQIHASCILYNQFKKVNSIYESGGCGLEGYFGAYVGSDTASLMREVKQLKGENKELKEKMERECAVGPEDASALEKEVKRLREENRRLREEKVAERDHAPKEEDGRSREKKERGRAATTDDETRH